MKIYRWINEERFANATREETIDGVRMMVTLSPFNTPTRVSGELSSDGNSFVIKFDYIDDEPGGEPKIYGPVSVVEGKHTGKLLSIILPVDRPPIQQPRVIEVVVNELKSKAIEALQLRQKRLRSQGKTDNVLNQTVAEEIIAHDLDELVTK